MFIFDTFKVIFFIFKSIDFFELAFLRVIFFFIVKFFLIFIITTIFIFSFLRVKYLTFFFTLLSFYSFLIVTFLVLNFFSIILILISSFKDPISIAIFYISLISIFVTLNIAISPSFISLIFTLI